MTDELLTMDEYQDMALATWARTPGDGDSDLAYLTLGMVGETGEVAEHIKKRMPGFGHGCSATQRLRHRRFV